MVGISLKYQRRHAVQKGKHKARLALKKIIQALSGVLVLVALGYGTFWCLDPAHFPISSVRFVGYRHYLSQEALSEAVLPEIKAGFLRLKPSFIQQSLMSLPWIKQVDIRKVWPDQLIVVFEEHVPAAFWGEKGIINDSGKLFFPEFIKKDLPALPRLQGPEGKSTLVWQQYLVMKKTLEPLNLTIRQLILAPRGAWQFQLSNGVTVVLGTNDTEQRLARFVKSYEKYLYEHQQVISYVDMRYTNGMAVGWKSF
ncbi:MAG: cell division protein FtsQ/DivIB [Proteobacteria bacterium]|nr:cell division protein FtsQ/DivIB [Pseudomonadota bacterium]